MPRVFRSQPPRELERAPARAVTFQNSATVTDAYGIASTDVTIQQTGNITVSAALGGQSYSFSGLAGTSPPSAPTCGQRCQFPDAGRARLLRGDLRCQLERLLGPATTTVLPLASMAQRDFRRASPN